MSMKFKSYSEVIKLKSFEERFEYLRLNGVVCGETFGSDRYLNQILYHSDEWRRFRNRIITRDNGCDLGCRDREVFDKILVHHINPITIEDVINRSPSIFNPDNVICTSLDTHNAIHYGDISLLNLGPIERKPNDTCPWK